MLYRAYIYKGSIMKGVVSVTKITVTVRKEALLEGKWIAVPVLSTYLHTMETEGNLRSRELRAKFCSSLARQGYETKKINGLLCIDIEKPMRKVCPLEIVFEVMR